MSLTVMFSVTMALLVALVVTIWPELSPAPQTLRPGALFVAIGIPATWILLTILGQHSAWVAPLELTSILIALIRDCSGKRSSRSGVEKPLEVVHSDL